MDCHGVQGKTSGRTRRGPRDPRIARGKGFLAISSLLGLLALPCFPWPSSGLHAVQRIFITGLNNLVVLLPSEKNTVIQSLVEKPGCQEGHGDFMASQVTANFAPFLLGSTQAR